MPERFQKRLGRRPTLAITPLLVIHRGGEPAALLDRIVELAVPVGEFNAAGVKLKPLRHARVAGASAGERGFGDRILVEDRQYRAIERRLDLGSEDTAEHVGPCIIRARGERAGKSSDIPVQHVDIRKLAKRFGDRNPDWRRRDIRGCVAPAQSIAAQTRRRAANDGDAIVLHGVIGLARTVPFQHREFRRMKRAALASAVDMTEAEYLPLACRQEPLHSELRRGMQVAILYRIGRQVRLGAGHSDDGADVHLDEALIGKPAADSGQQLCARQEKRTAVGVSLRAQPARHANRERFPAPAAQGKRRPTFLENGRSRRPVKGFIVVKVIASDVRKGNVLEHEDGKLYVVMSAESFRPGKGTPTTTITMRRIVDGLKTQQTYKTTDGLEKAFVEEVKHTYLFEDGDQGFVFMNPESYEQVTITKDMAASAAAYLAPEMEVFLTMHDGQALSLELPPRVTLEVVETEPVVKGQTASSSYKPAKLSNGIRSMVPPHIETGTRIVVSTEDGSYQERAKD